MGGFSVPSLARAVGNDELVAIYHELEMLKGGIALTREKGDRRVCPLSSSTPSFRDGGGNVFFAVLWSDGPARGPEAAVDTPFLRLDLRDQAKKDVCL